MLLLIQNHRRLCCRLNIIILVFLSTLFFLNVYIQRKIMWISQCFVSDVHKLVSYSGILINFEMFIHLKPWRQVKIFVRMSQSILFIKSFQLQYTVECYSTKFTNTQVQNVCRDHRWTYFIIYIHNFSVLIIISLVRNRTAMELHII